MMQTLWAVVHDGKIELADPAGLSEGSRVLGTLVPDDENRFWLGASETPLASIWDNAADDAYGQLLEE